MLASRVLPPSGQRKSGPEGRSDGLQLTRSLPTPIWEAAGAHLVGRAALSGSFSLVSGS